MSIDVRTITDDELGPWLETVETAFGADVRDDDVERWRQVARTERMVGAFDGESVVGGGGSFVFSLTVPGGRQLPAAGVTAVGVLPTHRRRGILRRMMAQLLVDALAVGEPMAILWASEGTIYQRFGYGLATLNGRFDIERARTAFRTGRPASGTVRLVDDVTAKAAMPAVYDAVARETPGFFGRDKAWWEARTLADPQHWRDGASRKFRALHERDGQPTGYALYRIKEDWGDQGSRSELRLQEVMGVDVEAERDVFEFLFGIDLIHRIVRWFGPPQPPLLLQLGQPELLGARLNAGIWLRILDVPAALAGRGYAADGEVVLEVTDEYLPDVAGRWRLSVRDGAASVEPTTDPAELLLEINDLGSLYLGGFSLAELARAGRTREHVAGARARADRMFATDLPPWCPQVF